MSQIIPMPQDYLTRSLVELEGVKKYCQELLKTPYYQKMGEVGVFAIAQKAKSLGISPIEALNGGMYFVNGKVEMQGQMMLSLIRKAGHSVVIDSRSTNTHVIMHGKRADNGDTWTVEFSVEDAKRAGIFKNSWEKFPKTMCTWRCVSQLARFLFSDMLRDCYVEGEITENFNQPIVEVKAELPALEYVSQEQAKSLCDLLNQCTPEFQNVVEKRLQTIRVKSDLTDLPLTLEEKFRKSMEENIAKCKAALQPQAIGE